MFRLSRQVRLGVADEVGGSAAAVRNGYAGYPPLGGFDRFVCVDVSIGGKPDGKSGYVINIRQIDEAVRREGLPILREGAASPGHAGGMALKLFERFRKVWPRLESIGLQLSPFTGYSVLAGEYPMVRLSQKFEFSAAHRLHNPELGEKENQELFGKCNNPNGHGHNYELQVSLRGKILPIAVLEEAVASSVIRKFDHKFLNLDTQEFRTLNPTVENIAQVVFRLLRPALAAAGGELAAVTVWETPKTWCEYWE